LGLYADHGMRVSLGELAPLAGRTLDSVFSTGVQPAELPDLRENTDPSLPPVVPFPGLMLPFLRTGASWLREWSRERGARLASAVERQALGNLALRLRSISTPTVVLELQVARLEERLVGDTPEERFRDFAERRLAGRENLLSLFGEYPVLAQRLCGQLRCWFEATTEMLSRFEADRVALARLFARGGNDIALAGLSTDLSDPHQGGRCVWRVDLSDGSRIVYKPKPLQVDVRFQELLAWLDRRGLRRSPRLLKVLDRAEYGWVEHVSHRSCPDRPAVERFYARLGNLLALLYTLQAVDFHHENLIADGEHPVLVDLESLLHPRLSPADGSAHARALERLQRSVCAVGILPAWMRSADGRRATDLSGMGGRKGTTFAAPMPRVQDWASDTMRIARGEVPVRTGGNSPLLAGEEVDAGAFTDAVVDGFEEAYDLVIAHRESFTRHLETFADATLRYIPRPTLRYSLLHHRALHPDHLRSTADQVRLFETLGSVDGSPPGLERLRAAESEALARGDVPLFTTRGSSRDLWDDGGNRTPGFFAEDGLTRARDALGRLGARDREEQVGLIRMSMLTRERGTAFRTRPDPDAPGEAPTAKREAWLAAAVSIGDHLRARAIHGEEDVTWIGLTLRVGPDPAWELSPLSSSLYDGVAGLALFFAWLGAATQRSDFTDVARRAAHRIRASMEGRGREDRRSIGAFSGRSGGLYVLAHLATLWNEPGLLDEVLEAELDRLAVLIPEDPSLDVLGGAAGCAMVLLGLRDRSSRCLDLARLCAERLLERATPQTRGLGWIGAVSAVPLAGFSHGAAGIAWALLALSEALGDERYAEAARLGIEFERTLYVAEQRDWLDRRLDPPCLSSCSAWCNGAAGVGFGRLLIRHHVDDEASHREIETAIGRTLESGFGGDHSLCHGAIGNVEIVLQAADILGRADWRRAALKRAAAIRAAVARGDWRCGTPRELEIPSFMTGLAGIGYGMLRLWSGFVPSILRLEPAALGNRGRSLFS